MSKTKKPRNKVYRQKPIAVHGGLIAIAKCHARGQDAAPLKADQTTDIGLAYWLSFENLRSGAATEEAWSCLACALNVGMVLCEKDVGKDHEPLLVRALDGLFRAQLRSKKAGNWRLDGEALRDVEEGLQVHDQQMALATRAEVTAALNAVHARQAAGNVYKEAA